MKLATFTESGQTRIGVVVGEQVIDLSKAAPSLPTDMLSFLEAGDAAMKTAAEAQSKGGDALALNAVTLEAPILNPGKILAIGLNYKDHVEESGMEMPKFQMWFNKQRNCVAGPYEGVNLPKASTDYLDYEGELCYIIGKRAKHVPRDQAHKVIAGYFVGDDVSVRDWQIRVQTMQIGKSFDTHGPIGPWIVTPDEVGDPHNLGIRTFVNGEKRQDSNTKHLIFDCYDQIEHLTQAFTLDPGDIIFTGTSSGVGGAMKPPSFLKEGDVVRVEIEKLGHIENKIVPEKAETIIG